MLRWFFVSLIFVNLAYAKTTSLDAYLSCSEKSKKCLEFKDLFNRTVKVEKSSKKTFIVAEVKPIDKGLALIFDKNSVLGFEKFTDKGRGKNIVLVKGNTVILNALIQTKISNGNIQLSFEREEDLKNICVQFAVSCNNEKPAPKKLETILPRKQKQSNL